MSIFYILLEQVMPQYAKIWTFRIAVVTSLVYINDQLVINYNDTHQPYLMLTVL